jgi:hypothetical protein
MVRSFSTTTKWAEAAREWPVGVGHELHRRPDAGPSDHPGASSPASASLPITFSRIRSYMVWHLRSRWKIGSIEIGKFADIVVLDRNPLDAPSPGISETRVLTTVCGGDVIYKADEQGGAFLSAQEGMRLAALDRVQCSHHPCAICIHGRHSGHLN